MITASEPLEFIPRGRHSTSYHPGPIRKETPKTSLMDEMILLQRMQNVKISTNQDESTEFYSLREVVIQDASDEAPKGKPTPYFYNEEELYVNGHTAVWTYSLGNAPNAQAYRSFTIERPIKHAFFSPPHFLEHDTISGEKHGKRNGICIVDDEVLHVYCDNGDTYGAKLEGPISAFWIVPFGLMVEKQPSNSLVLNTHSLPMPRLFTMPYPMDEMKPVLHITNDVFTSCDYMTDPANRVVFTSDQVELVLMYNLLERKHFICWMYLASEERRAEAQSRQYESDTCSEQNEGDDMFFNNAGACGVYSSSNKGPSGPGMSTSGLLAGHASGRTSPLPPFDRFPTEAAGGGGQQPMEGTSKNTASAAAMNFLQNIGPISSLETMFNIDQNVYDARRAGFAGSSQPIEPEYCLERIWQEQSIGNAGGGFFKRYSGTAWGAPSGNGEMASVGFLHTDLIGDRYICFLQPGIAQLSLVRFKLQTPLQTAPLVVAVHTLPACTAVSLEQLNLLILLDPAGKLMLYSGSIAVGKVHVSGLLYTSFLSTTGFCSSAASSGAGHAPSQPVASSWKRSSLLPNVAPYDSKFEEELHLLSPVRGVPAGGETNARPNVKLCDATGTRFTVAYNGGITDASGNGRSFRVGLSPLAESQLVHRCLEALRKVLPSKNVHEVLIRWYGTRNVPGTHAGLSIWREWSMFQTFLLSAMGRPVVSSDAPAQTSQEASGPNVSVCFEKKRRRGENTQGTKEDWEYLVHNITREPVSIAQVEGAFVGLAAGRTYSEHTLVALYRFIPEVLQVLHLLYEDLKLDTGLNDEMRLLGEFLHILATDAGASRYQRHYSLDFPELSERNHTNVCRISDEQLRKRIEWNAKSLPDIFSYLHVLIERLPAPNEPTQGGAPEAFVPYPHIAGINDRSRDVVVLVALIYRERRLTRWVQEQLDKLLCPEHFDAQLVKPLLHSMPGAPAQNHNELLGNIVLHFLIQRGYTRERLDDMPVGVRFVLLQMLEQLRELAMHGHDKSVYRLLLRPDLHRHAVSAGLSQTAASLEGLQERPADHRTRREEQRNQWLTDMAEFDALMGVVSTKEDPQRLEREDGMDNLDQELLRLRFPYDRRIDDVRSFMTSSVRVLIDIPQSPNVSDHDFIEEQERRLYSLCLRTMALPIGRGMFTFATSSPAEGGVATIPRLCLAGREPLRGATVELVQLEVPQHMHLWPMFHNGVAAGLRISPDTPHITSAWILNNRHACRRTGAPSNSCPFSPSNEALAEHGGFLLALGMTGHLRQLSKYSIFDYMVRSHELMRIGMVLGLSAAYRGTEHKRTTCLLAVHVEALLPPTAVELDVPQTLQVAALFGVGLVHQGTAKRHIAEVLLQEIGRPPGPEMENAVERESYSLAAGLALGMVTLGRGEQLTGLRDLAIPGELYRYMTGGPRRMAVGAQREKYKMPSFQIREGDDVNLDITAPGATLALGFMFFGTGEPTVSGWLQPPDTKYGLGFVRPDLLLLRVIARNLICWDMVQPTRAWMKAQLPAILLDTVAAVEGRPNEGRELPASTVTSTRVERELYCQAYCAIVCGSAVGLGLRFAGTGDSVAADTLHHYLRYFIGLRHPKPSQEEDDDTPRGKSQGSRALAKLIGSQVLENCVLMTLLALSIVLAGTGDLRVLRTVRMLRSRIGVPGVTYGSHMAAHMALGFVYLGAGRYSLSRSPSAIAAIVCAIFPKFPVYSNDNRYHLQALRHLYVLALEPRMFVPRRIDTGKLTVCRIRYALLDAAAGTSTPNMVTDMSPCMLPELQTLAWVEVFDENFYTVRFNRDNWKMLENILNKRGYVDVVQHVGCLSYLEDPTRVITMRMHNLPGPNNSSWNVPIEQLLELPSQPIVLSLVRNLLLPPQHHRLRAAIEPMKNLPYANRAIHYFRSLVAHCVMYDRFHALPIMFEVVHMLLNPQQRRHRIPTDTCQLLLLRSSLGRWLGTCGERLDLLPGLLLRSYVLRAHAVWVADSRCPRTAQQDVAKLPSPVDRGNDEDSDNDDVGDAESNTP